MPALPTLTGALQSGDCPIRGLEDRFAIKRKSPADLVGSLTPEWDRFGREFHLLRGFDFARLLVVVWQPSPTAAALWMERAAWWFWREALKPAGVKPETPGWAVEILELLQASFSLEKLAEMAEPR